MKKQLLSFILIIYPLITFSQNNPLSKEETIEYLNKKSKEIVGHSKSQRSGDKLHFFNSDVILEKNGQVNFFYETKNKTEPQPRYGDCDYREYLNDIYFNPAHIRNIVFVNLHEGDAVGFLKIILINKLGKESISTFTNTRPSQYFQCSDLEFKNKEELSVTEINIPFLATDPDNFNRYKKALEHLRDLYKSEDDPFSI